MKIPIKITILFCLMSCANNQKEILKNDWEDTYGYTLEQENIKLLIPKQLKKSSLYRIKEDIPTLAKDSIQLSQIHYLLQILEFEDSEIDVFVDTTKTYRMIIICNIAKIDFSKKDVAIMKLKIKSDYENIALKYPNLEVNETIIQMKRNANHILARYTTPIRNILDNSKVYNTIYFLNGDYYTLVVYEFSEDEELIEKYLWTTKLY